MLPLHSTALQVILGEHRLVIEWDDGEQSDFDYVWLYDNAPTARDPRNGQRLIESIDIPPDIRATAVALLANNQIELLWSDGSKPSVFSADWLRHYGEECDQPDDLFLEKVWWDARLDVLPRANYAELVEQGRALRDWLYAVTQYGFAILHGVPIESEALFKVVDLFGHVRETNYGRYFDVKSVVNPTNLAYTGLALSPHTDNPYRDPVPTLQLLHCLQAVDNGGDSILVDGFAVAQQLLRTAPEHYDMLTTLPLYFRFQDQTTNLLASAPMIEVNVQQEVAAIRYNNRSLEPLTCGPELSEKFYAAYRTFGRMINDPANQITFKLAPGDLFIVDNERVLHGRTGFSSSGSRHLQGCYADRDGLLSTLRMLSRTVVQ